MFKCTKCGVITTSPAVKCPRCYTSGTLKPCESEKKALSEPVLSTESIRHSTGFNNLDNVLGNGMAEGCIHFLAAAPGIGKTTLLFQIAAFQLKNGRRVHFFTGEETPELVKARAGRLGITEFHPNVFYSSDIKELCDNVRKEQPHVLMIDSLQAMRGLRLQRLSYEGQASIMIQIRKLTEAFNIATWVIGHVNKDLKHTGPQLLKHDSDVFIEARRGWNDEVILTTPEKNRLGSTINRAVFRMTEKGLIEKDEKETGYILRHSDSFSIGLAAFITETAYGLSVDEITVSSIDKEKLLIDGGSSKQAVLLASIIQRYFPDFQPSHVVRANQSEKLLKGADLAIVMALLSHFYKKPLPREIAFIASLDSIGRLLPVPDMAQKVKRAKDQGYLRVFGAMPIGSQEATWQTAETILDVWTRLGF